MKRNLVLIGMPGAGKTAVGTLLAERLGIPIADTDAMTERAAGCTIPKLFETRGEPYFRDLETEMAHAAAALVGAVISTGGGMILRDENVAALRETGLIFFLDRPPEAIAEEQHGGRPLIGGDRARVFALYRERIDRYRACADHIIENGSSAEAAAEEILKIWNRKREESP